MFSLDLIRLRMQMFGCSTELPHAASKFYSFLLSRLKGIFCEYMCALNYSLFSLKHCYLWSSTEKRSLFFIFTAGHLTLSSVRQEVTAGTQD